MKKRTLLLILFPLLVLLATACGSEEPTTTPPRPDTPIPTPIVQVGPTTPPLQTTCDPSIPVTLELSSRGNEQFFDTDTFSVCPEVQVTLKYNNVSDTLDHNWVLVKAGTKNDVALRGASFFANGWIDPDDPDIIDNVHTSLLKPGESGEVAFTAPAAGTYQFVCTFPGHNITMFGDFVVTSGAVAPALATTVPTPPSTPEPSPTSEPAPTTSPTPTSAPEPSPTSAPALTTAVPTPTSAPAGPIKLEISVLGDQLMFDKESFTVPEGAEVTLTFNNASTIEQHNWVLIKAGTKDEVGDRGAIAGPANNWVDPNDPDIINNIRNKKLLEPGEIQEITFTAPAAGTYQFICTFPAHPRTMFGDFVVTK